MKREDNQSIKYIFDLYKWRQTIEQELKSLKKDEALWCDIPVELQFLAKALYQQYRMNNYARLPCHVIYSSSTTLKDVKCSYNRQNQAYFECKRGLSLDLFLSKSEKYSYPSLIADPDLPFSSYAYITVLNNQYRSCSSMWGFEFNYESIIYYPWMADRD
ncbi:unnamed protein product [Adineta steineri]|nr:unnamed protein product [Adineta steineri]